MKKLLSHHEIAMLFVLFSAPVQVARADPDTTTLEQESLVEVVRTAAASADVRLTTEGRALLQRFGLVKA